ncbi:Bicarbonate transport ATP-binding protein CmpC [BD1-7 clade bacterium]|uniref:Bicarbonate transport ATP-binding protein CmpC n=1 Tax=BD1-7 clade bacterium TaxID=2029982 RepID=A0A5S9QRP8_9GAMM|nr:Bicarbonate transport ATP-binding protein CmpC [BD1-7 clade bacterium]
MADSTIHIGYIPLIDSLPLIAARHLGLFKAAGLDIQLHKENSWANIRDKLVFGQIDAAHMLAPMALATSLGLSGLKTPLVTGFSFGLNGNAVTLDKKLHSELWEQCKNRNYPDIATALYEHIQIRDYQGKPPLKFATVFPYSCHYYQLRDWLENAGIDTRRQIAFVVYPPEQMTKHLLQGEIQGFCVGEPWNTLAMESGIGETISCSAQIWTNAPEKILAVTRLWAKKHHESHLKLINALAEAAEWIEFNRSDAAALVHEQVFAFLDYDIIEKSLTQGMQFSFDNNHISAEQLQIFNKHRANEPKLNDALFLLKKMQDSGQLPADKAKEVTASEIYLPELFDEAIHAESY